MSATTSLQHILNRFMRFVFFEPSTGCWLWGGATFDKGKYGSYGGFQLARRKFVSAHRLSYEMHTGPIPEGFVVDHTCRVKMCVNPQHLRAVTPQINVLENNESVCSLNARKTHCWRGHAFDEENTKLVPGGRECRECRRINKRLWRARVRSAA